MIVVYVSSADSGELLAFRLDPLEGTLAPLQTLTPGGKVMPMALAPDRRRLYLVRRSEPFEALAFSVDPASGMLESIGAGPLPHSMANIATDPGGRFLFSASFGGNLVAVSPIGGDGVVGAALQVLPTGPKAHAIQADPSGRYVFATSLGGGVVLQYRFDATTGRLTPNAVPELRPHRDASPRHFVFGADGRVVYLLGELDGKIDVLALDAETGTLRCLQTVSALPSGFEGEPWAADLHLRPDGGFLYASERRSHTLASFAVDAATGRLTPLGHKATEEQPRGFGITPDGAFLIVAGEVSHHLSVYRIDAHTGALHLASRCPAGRAPNWIECVEVTG